LPKRWKASDRRRLYSDLISRDGEHCTDCGKPPGQLNHPLEIDHVDENKSRDGLENLQLLCKSCNVSKQNRSRADRHASPGSQSIDGSRYEIPSAEREREKRGPQIPRFGLGALTGETTPPSVQISWTYRKKFEEWLPVRLKQLGALSTNEIINAASAYIPCSKKAASDYLDAMTSFEGPLVIYQDADGVEIVRFKENWTPLPAIEP